MVWISSFLKHPMTGDVPSHPFSCCYSAATLRTHFRGWAHAVHGGEMPGYPLLSTAAHVHETCEK